MEQKSSQTSLCIILKRPTLVSGSGYKHTADTSLQLRRHVWTLHALYNSAQSPPLTIEMKIYFQVRSVLQNNNCIYSMLFFL